MGETADLTIEILKQIRDEIRVTRADLSARIDETNARLDQTNARLDQTNSRLDQTNSRLDQTNSRLDRVEETLLELAQQQRFVVKHLRASRKRELRIEADIIELRKRVEAIESRLGLRE